MDKGFRNFLIECDSQRVLGSEEGGRRAASLQISNCNPPAAAGPIADEMVSRAKHTAQGGDLIAYGGRPNIVGGAPYLFKQLAVRNDATLVLHEVGEHVEFSRTQSARHTENRNAPLEKIDRHRRDAQHIVPR